MEIVGAMEKQGITPGTFYIYYVCNFAIFNMYYLIKFLDVFQFWNSCFLFQHGGFWIKSG